MKGDILIVKAVRVTPVLDVRKEEVLSVGYICIKYGAYHKLKACPICHFKIKKPCLNENPHRMDERIVSQLSDIVVVVKCSILAIFLMTGNAKFKIILFLASCKICINISTIIGT